MKTKDIILLLATITTGLVAGLFYAYEVSVNNAFTKLQDAEYIKAMQAINIAIINPSFMFCFLGTSLLLPLAAFVHKARPVSQTFILLVIASLLYIIGTIGVTMIYNVPLNNHLASLKVNEIDSRALAKMRSSFALPWNKWNSVRTTASLMAFVLAAAACLWKKAE